MTNAEARFNKIHIRKVYACLAVTCHLHFWQNDRDFLRATVVTRGWNGYRNKSQHRKSTLEKKILPPFQQGFEPATFQSRVRCSNHWAIPAPLVVQCSFKYSPPPPPPPPPFRYHHTPPSAPSYRSVWLSHTLMYSPVCFSVILSCFQIPRTTDGTVFCCWFPRLFCLRSFHME